MIIESEYGKVDGVELTGSDGRSRTWTKHENGRTISFSSDDGWAEVPEPRWVDVTGAQAIAEKTGVLLFPYPKQPVCPGEGYRFQKVDRYAIDPCDVWGVATTKFKVDYLAWLQQFKTPCLIIQRKETP